MDIVRLEQTVRRLPSLHQQDMLEVLSHVCATPYNKGAYDPKKAATVVETCVEKGHLSILEHCNITLKCRTNIGTYKDFTRHRHCAFTIESTSFSKYDEDVFVITVGALTNEERNVLLDLMAVYRSHPSIKVGRDFLPQCCAATMIMTTNIREWRHIIATRGDPNDNPLTNQLRDKMWVTLNSAYPFFFPLDGKGPMCIYDTWGARRPSVLPVS
jgi:thymidylate synthase (FAD)